MIRIFFFLASCANDAMRWSERVKAVRHFSVVLFLQFSYMQRSDWNSINALQETDFHGFALQTRAINAYLHPVKSLLLCIPRPFRTHEESPGPRIASKYSGSYLCSITIFARTFCMREIAASLIWWAYWSWLNSTYVASLCTLWLVLQRATKQQIIFWFYLCQVLNWFYFNENSDIMYCVYIQIVGHAICMPWGWWCHPLEERMMMRRLEAACSSTTLAEVRGIGCFNK